MSLRVSVLIAILIAVAMGSAMARDLDDYISEATEFQAANEPGKAMEVMQAAVTEYPENCTATAYLGLFTGMTAGEATDYMEAGRLVSTSFDLLDDAVASRAALLLYENLLSSGPGQALRQTLLSLREEHPHPALWAGLQLYGNPRPWEDEP